MSSNLMNLINARKASLNRVKTLKPPVGRSRYRILPSWKGDDQQFWADYGQHFIKDAAGQIKAVYVCEAKTFGQPCPVCHAIEQGIAASQDDLTVKRLTDANSSARVLLNVLHIDGPTPNVVQVLEVAPTVFNGHRGVGGVLSAFQDWPDLIDLKKGSDIIIEKSGAGKETRYGVSVVPGKPIDPALMSQLHDLDQFVASESEQTRQKALSSVSAISGVPAVSGGYVAAAPRIAAPASHGASNYSMDDADDELREIEVSMTPASSVAPGTHALSASSDLEKYLEDL